MLNIAVLDDEPVYMDHICRITDACMRQMEITYEIRTYEAGRQMLEDLADGAYFDIYLLDVEMPDINGLEAAKRIRRKFSEPVLIYITNHINYAVDAFEVNTYRYIPKHMLDEKLPKAYHSMEEMLKKKREADRCYLIEHYKQQKKIYYRDIYYLKKNGKYVIIVHKDGEDRIRKTISDVIEELQAEAFLMIDRGYAVNTEHVESVKNYQVHIRNGDILTVSRSRWHRVRDIFMDGE